MTDYLDPSDVEPLLNRLGFHVRSRNLLLSALAAPLPVFGEEVHPTLSDKAAALIIAFNRNHPMVDGNKRSSWYVTNLFLELNNHTVTASQDEMFDFILSVADAHAEFASVKTWFRMHLRPRMALSDPVILAARQDADRPDKEWVQFDWDEKAAGE